MKSTWLITSELANQRSRKEIPQKRESAIFLGQFRQGQICLHPETRCTTLFDRCVGPLTSPANHMQRMQETGPTKYSTFSLVILGPLSVWSEGSNPQPTAQQSGALPIELTRRRRLVYDNCITIKEPHVPKSEPTLHNTKYVY